MPMLNPGVLRELGQGIGAILEIGSQVSDFIKDDLPPNAAAFPKWGQEALRRSCRQGARATVPGLGEVWSPIWGRVCDPYLSSINEGPTSEGSYGPPFTGGQCSNINYRVFANRIRATGSPNGCINDGVVEITPSGGVIGPIRGIRYGSGSAGSEPIETAYLRHGQNQEFSLGARFVGCPQPFFSNLSFIPLGGQDNCGNPPSEYTPPRYPPNLPPLSPPTNPAPGVGTGWDVTINPDGTFKVCWGSECTPNLDPGGKSPATGEDPGEPDGDPKENDPDDPNDDTIEGCAGEGRILTGLKITFTQIPLAVSGPLDYYRNVCYVGFGPDLNLIDLVIDGKLVKDGQFVIPDSEFCRCYRVIVSPGWGLSVQAYSRPEKTE